MKSVLKFALAVSLVLSTVSTPKVAEAGLFAIGYSRAKVLAGPASSQEEQLDLWGLGMLGGINVGFGVIMVLTMPTFFGIGAIILDQDQTTLNFESLDLEAAVHMGLTETEYLAFNAHVEIFNAIASEIEASLTEDTTLQDVSSAWDYYLQELQVEPVARYSLEVVSNHFLANLQ